MPSGTKLQVRTRHERSFSATEARLPRAIQRPTTLTQELWSSPSPWSDSNKLTDLLSYLGPWNPLPQPVTGDHVVWLLDNVAFRADTASTMKDKKLPFGTMRSIVDWLSLGGSRAHKLALGSSPWQAEFVAAVFAQQPSCKISDAVHQVATLLELEDAPNNREALKRIETRLLPFLWDIVPGRVVTVEFGEDGRGPDLNLGPGGRNGISSDLRRVPRPKEGGGQGRHLVVSRARAPDGTNGVLWMKTQFVEPEGWGVISDIDDTIKITRTGDPIGILKSTFVAEAEPVSGMPALYKHIAALITPSAPFFYLSASPYNLYPFLRAFRDQHYPHGQLILRDDSWMSIPGLLSSLTLATHDYKVDRMRKVRGWLPRRKMILIGDSTQSDPESYGDIYRAFPDWVRVILVRKVTDVATVGIEAKNKPSRFEAAFEGVPRSVWHVFEDPRECFDILKTAVST